MTDDRRADLERRLAELAAAIAEAEGAEGRAARHRRQRLIAKADTTFADLGNLEAELASVGGGE